MVPSPKAIEMAELVWKAPRPQASEVNWNQDDSLIRQAASVFKLKYPVTVTRTPSNELREPCRGMYFTAEEEWKRIRRVQILNGVPDSMTPMDLSQNGHQIEIDASLPPFYASLAVWHELRHAWQAEALYNGDIMAFALDYIDENVKRSWTWLIGGDHNRQLAEFVTQNRFEDDAYAAQEYHWTHFPAVVS